MKRALVLGGGGTKIGWASGALEVLLDEANLKFDHYDATSGSVFNLGMLLSGRSATHVADAWANLSPREILSFHPWQDYLTFWRLPSLVTPQATVERILPRWGVDLERIRACTEVNGHPASATFNVVDFGTKRVEVIPHTDMDLDYFLAVDAVPGVMPPVEKDGTRYVDAMLLKDANLLEAVRRGADEIWVLWTVEDTPEWKGGVMNHLGHVFEICAVGNLKRELDVIEAMNARVAAGNPEPGDRHVTVHLIEPDEPIPLGYLYYRHRRQMQPIIEAGRAFMRRYLSERGYLDPRPEPPIGRGVRFTETMSGRFAPDGGGAGRRAGDFEFTLTITVPDVERFIADPEHRATAQGVVRAERFGGTCRVTRGTFNLFSRDPGGERQMEYDLEFKTADDRRYVMRGVKRLGDAGTGRLWADTTTLDITVEEATGGRRVGRGLLRISPQQFARQLTTFEALGTATPVETAETLGRFGRFFLGGLWDTYGPVAVRA